jgi:tetratricopeptide (TPR) repeat protein
VANAVSSAVHLELTAGDRRRIGRRHTDRAEAFEPYLRGRHRLDRFEAAAQHEALELFGRACAADPEYPMPLLGIARCRLNLALLGVAAPKDVVPGAKDALRRALNLDPELAEAHSLMASVISHHEWNWAEAETHYRLALRLAPHNAEVHDEYATGFLAPFGRIEEALAENRAARGLDPFSAQPERSYVFILLLARRLPDAELECRRILEKRPEDGYVRLVLALSLHGQRRVAEALPEYERVYAGDPSLQHEGYVADVRALLGDRRPAEELLVRLTGRARHEFVPAMIFAWLYLHLGRIDEAVTAIEQAACNGEYELLVAKMGYGFDAFRHHPRFRAIVASLGLD